MTQNFSYSFNLNNIAQEDLKSIEATFNTLRTNFSGLSTPPGVQGQLWFGGSIASGRDRLRIKNWANSSWLGVMLGDDNQKIWVYRHPSHGTMDGWVVDPTVTDVVTGIRATSGVWNVDPGTIAGTWTEATHQHTMEHNHGWYDVDDRDPFPRIRTFDISGALREFIIEFGSEAHPLTGFVYDDSRAEDVWVVSSDTPVRYYTSNSPEYTGFSGATASWRPAAAVGQLQYLNLEDL